MKLNELTAVPGSTKSRKRLGRGIGSGTGKTAGRGHKGAGQRSGGNIRPGFEGGQMPLSRRIPKRGFTNHFAIRFVPVNVGDLDRFEAGSVVGLEELKKAGLVKKSFDGVKILGNGELTKALTVKAVAFSGSAKEKIEAAGGKAEVI